MRHSYLTECADIVIVGGGLSGMAAAFRAHSLGARVVIVDKGPFGHSGNTGVNWGQSFESAESNTDGGAQTTEFLILDAMGILDQEHAKSVVQAQIEGRPRFMLEQIGNIFQRDDEGSIVGSLQSTGLHASPDAHSTGLAQLIRSEGIPIYEHTMMLDILLDESGAAAGIVALNLKDGKALVVQAPYVILATGGYHWAKGVTAGSPESTGDGHAALLRRGLAFKDMEFPQYDFSGIRPFGWRTDKEQDMLEIGISMSVNGEVCGRIRNRFEQPLIDPDAPDFAEDEGLSLFQETLIAAARELLHGRGTRGDGSNNGLYFELSEIMDDPSTQAFPTYKGHIINVEHNMGFTFPEMYEVIANEYSSCGIPRVNPHTNETEIPGLYAAFVTLSARASMYSWAQGYLSATNAAKQVADNKHRRSSIKDEDVQRVLDFAYGLLQREAPAQALSSQEESEDIEYSAPEVFRRIQRTFYQGYGFIKEGSEMEAALSELERIRREYLPRMFCRDRSRLFNRDWRSALEAYNMLLCCEASLHAGLARKESRSPFFRKDYPQMNNRDFLCFIWVKQAEEGAWHIEKGELVDTVIPKKRLAQLLGEVDISVSSKKEGGSHTQVAQKSRKHQGND